MKWIYLCFIGIFVIFEQASSRQLLYKEEFYRLYYLPLYHTQHDYNRNIFWLQIAMKAAWAPPIQALVISKKPVEYQKYQLLIRMHLNYLMTKNAVYLGARYDKHEPRWFNKPYKKEILESLEIARYYYLTALRSWQEVLKYKKELQTPKFKFIHIDLFFTEDMIVRIDSKDLNYERVVKRQLAKIEQTIDYFNAL